MKRHLVKGCGCSGKGYVLEIDGPASKTALPVFKQAGYKVSDMYTRVGVFFVERNGLTASGPFGGMKMQIRCSNSANCNQLLDHLENTFKIATTLPAQEPGK
jgi:hypothetical protein